MLKIIAKLSLLFVNKPERVESFYSKLNSLFVLPTANWYILKVFKVLPLEADPDIMNSNDLTRLYCRNAKVPLTSL